METVAVLCMDLVSHSRITPSILMSTKIPRVPAFPFKTLQLFIYMTQGSNEKLIDFFIIKTVEKVVNTY